MNFVLFGVLLVLFFSPTLSATLSVSDFTCNSGLLNVQVAFPFNCVAVVLNDDLQVDAALATVSLSSLEGWSASTSYSGTFSGNTVPKGSTVSVTFSDIVATTPGSGKKFTDVLVNGGAGNSAKLADAPLNVLSIKSTTLSTSASTVSYGESFQVVSSVLVGGQSTVTQELGLSGCTLGAGQAVLRNYGLVSDSVQSTSWTVTQSSASGSTCTVTVETKASNDPVSINDIRTTTVIGAGSVPVTSSTTTSGSGPVTGASQTVSVSGGGGGSSGSSSSSGGSGGAPPSGSGESFVISGIEPTVETKGGTLQIPFTLTSFYANLVNRLEINVKGVPKEWVKLPDLPRYLSLGNTSLEVELVIPPGSVGTYDVEIELTGMSVRPVRPILVKKSFQLVLPSAPVLGESAPRKVQTPLELPKPSETPSLIEPIQNAGADQTNYGLVLSVVVLFAGGLAIYRYFSDSSKAVQNPSEEKKEEKTTPTTKSGKKR